MQRRVSECGGLRRSPTFSDHRTPNVLIHMQKRRFGAKNLRRSAAVPGKPQKTRLRRSAAVCGGVSPIPPMRLLARLGRARALSRAGADGCTPLGEALLHGLPAARWPSKCSSLDFFHRCRCSTCPSRALPAYLSAPSAKCLSMPGEERVGSGPKLDPLD